VTPPTPAAFVRLLEAELRLRRAAFELRDLLAFAETAWPTPGAWRLPASAARPATTTRARG
jgi:hypothetical protein